MVSVVPIQLRPPEAAARWNVSEAWLEKKRHKGGGPAFVKPSSRVVLYNTAEGDQWFAEHRRQNTSGERRKPQGAPNAAA